MCFIAQDLFVLNKMPRNIMLQSWKCVLKHTRKKCRHNWGSILRQHWGSSLLSILSRRPRPDPLTCTYFHPSPAPFHTLPPISQPCHYLCRDQRDSSGVLGILNCASAQKSQHFARRPGMLVEDVLFQCPVRLDWVLRKSPDMEILLLHTNREEFVTSSLLSYPGKFRFCFFKKGLFNLVGC